MVRKAMRLILCAAVAAAAIACVKDEPIPSGAAPGKGETSMSVKSEPFGTLPDGTPVAIYTLTNRKGLEARIMTYGATLVSLRLPDRNGRLDDVNLGFDGLAGYLGTHPYFGVIVGRYANRIAQGRFNLGGVTYTLARNNNGNSLHGGLKGFDKVVWKAEPMPGTGAVGVKLTYLSKDMEEGYPGNLAATVVYTLTDADELKIAYALVAAWLLVGLSFILSTQTTTAKQSAAKASA